MPVAAPPLVQVLLPLLAPRAGQRGDQVVEVLAGQRPRTPATGSPARVRTACCRASPTLRLDSVQDHGRIWPYSDQRGAVSAGLWPWRGRPAHAGPNRAGRADRFGLFGGQAGVARGRLPRRTIVQLAAVASRALPSVASRAIGFADPTPGVHSPGSAAIEEDRYEQAAAEPRTPATA